MEKHPLAGLEPANVWHFFEQICAIPHGSRDTKKISDFLVNFAQERNLKYRQDEFNNVIIWKDGTAGYEDHAPVVLQGHIDMVCEKDPDCTIDFEKDGLDLTHNDEFIYAKGTTLGGDDGIAVCYMMALLDAKDLSYPPLECIFTVDEEIGMLGAADIDLSDLKGRMLINLDSEEEGILTVSCAGGATSFLELPVERKPAYGPVVCLKVDGLIGGHSGAEIHKNRGNANKIMAEFLTRIQEKMPVCISSLAGGAKDNAIPRSCKVNLVAMDLNLEVISDIAKELTEECRKTYAEPDVIVTAEKVEAMGGNAVTAEDSKKIAGLMMRVPNAIQSMSKDIEGLVQTSLNMGVANLSEDHLLLTFSVRSSMNQEKIDLIGDLKKAAEEFGAKYSQMGEYPAWEYRKDSPLRDLMVSTYEKMFNVTPEVAAIHAGLECGILGDKLPGLDAVSMGPEMHDVHTSRERLHIASSERMWKYLLELLRQL